MNTKLLQEFRAEEVVQALHWMYPTKSTRSDSMPAFFHKKYWRVVGNSVIAAVLETLNSGHILKKTSYTHVALVPKTIFPEK